jgi:hypothetical protein
MRMSDGTYLCSSFNVSSTNAGVSLLLNDVYSVSSDGKINWIGNERQRETDRDGSSESEPPHVGFDWYAPR